MVFTSKILLSSKPSGKRTFIDKIRLYVRGGSGGQGLPKYGGQGGRGGHVYVVGEEGTMLKNLINQFPRKRFIAEAGCNSKGSAIFGEPGKDLYIPVPPGIVIRTDTDRIIGEINEPDDKVLVAKGGNSGGPANNYLGRKGHALSVILDLKLIADIGLVGPISISSSSLFTNEKAKFLRNLYARFPNAGKSTLLSVLSRASPKIASYPFTTIQPQLGIMNYDDDRRITVADLPGLIEGAHVNVGMGHSFLKHIERTSLLLFVVDIHGFRLGASHTLRSALENIFLLNKELELYKPELVDKPAVLVINKVDIAGSDGLVQELVHTLGDTSNCLEKVADEFKPEKMIKFDEIISISAKYRLNTDYLKQRLRKWLDLYAELEFDKDHVHEKSILQAHLTEHRASKVV